MDDTRTGGAGGPLGGMERRFNRGVETLEPIFAFVRDVSHVHAIEPAAAFAINVAVEELFVNMVRYNAGGASGISIRFEKQGDDLHVVLTDFDADPFDPNAFPEPDLDGPLSERAVGGLGLHLVRQLMDAVRYEYHDRRSTITLTKKLVS